MSSSLLLHECPACLVRLTFIVLVMEGRWPYSCFVGCCLQDLLNFACSILVQLPSSFFSIRLVSVGVVNPYSCIDINVNLNSPRYIIKHIPYPVNWRIKRIIFLKKILENYKETCNELIFSNIVCIYILEKLIQITWQHNKWEHHFFEW